MDEVATASNRSTVEGIERRRLLQVLSDLTDEGGGEAGPERGQRTDAIAAQHPLDAKLGEEDEELVVELRAGLARLAGLRPGEPAEGAMAVNGALDGAEFVVRGNILSGQSARLPQLLPSFVFLVLLPLLGKAEALRVAERAACLLGRG